MNLTLRGQQNDGELPRVWVEKNRLFWQENAREKKPIPLFKTPTMFRTHVLSGDHKRKLQHDAGRIFLRRCVLLRFGHIMQNQTIHSQGYATQLQEPVQICSKEFPKDRFASFGHARTPVYSSCTIRLTWRFFTDPGNQQVSEANQSTVLYCLLTVVFHC
jgi:hypothetical protein